MNNKHPIRIGNQTAFSATHVEDPFHYAVSSDFDAFEWLPDKKESGAGWVIQDIPRQRRHTLRTMAHQHDIRISVHAPCDLDWLQPNAFTHFKEYLVFACDMGASLLNIHFQNDQGIRAYVDSITPLIKDCLNNRLYLAIENTPLTGPDDMNALFWKIHRMNLKSHRFVGMCLDIGHANLNASTQNDYVQYMDLLNPDVPIIHVHVHENYGDSDSHLPFFTGPSGKDPSGIQGILNRLIQRRFSGSLILEQWPQPRSLLNNARERLLAILEKDFAS